MKTLLIRYSGIIFSLIINSVFNGIQNITKLKLDILMILFSTINYGRPSLLILFLLGLINDVINFTPLGLSSLIYIITSVYSENYRHRLISSTLILKLLIFFTLIVFITFIEYLTNYFYSNSSTLNTSIIIESLLAIICYYLLLGKKTNSVSSI